MTQEFFKLIQHQKEAIEFILNSLRDSMPSNVDEQIEKKKLQEKEEIWKKGKNCQKCKL